MFEIKIEDLNILKTKDPLLRKIIDKYGLIERTMDEDIFLSLISSIIFQQLAYSAAKAIWDRLNNLIDLTPKNIIDANEENLKSIGISNMKISYLKSLANAFINDGYDKLNWKELSNNEVIEKLVKIKGIGIWTAEMFLIFTLGRKNVISFNDLGIRNGIKKLYKLDELDVATFNDIINNYGEFLTIAGFYIWEYNGDKKYEIDMNVNYSLGKNNSCYIYSKLGWLYLESENDKLNKINFVKYPKFKSLEINQVLLDTIKELNLYFENKLKEFTIPLNLKGTNFQISVWNELKKIPYGNLISYEELALKFNDANKKRAVANANGKNNIPIIIPCHRVISKSGKLGGYSGGLDKKIELLKIENIYDKVKQ